MVWRLYGNEYDLSSFIDKHPGARDILLKTEGQYDLTSLFETYHAFTNKQVVKDNLNKYKFIKNENQTSFDYDLYNNLVAIVRETHGFKQNNIKAPLQQLIFISFLLFAYFASTCLCIDIKSKHY